MNPARYILFLLLGTFFAVLGVAQRANADHLGYRIGKVRTEQARLVLENRELLCEISALSYPARIADEIGRLNIALVDPVALTKAPLTEEAEAKDGDKHLVSNETKSLSPGAKKELVLVRGDKGKTGVKNAPEQKKAIRPGRR